MRLLISILAVICVLSAILAVSVAEDEYFIICNPKTYVCVRKSPKKSAEETGWLDFGDSILTDGVKKNGYLHVLGITEDGEGWVFAGNVVGDKPQKLKNARANVAATGRVMSYRWINGARNGYVKLGTDVYVYAISDEWAVTDRGYIRTEYLEVWYE